jgi:hypothetical protein
LAGIFARARLPPASCYDHYIAKALTSPPGASGKSIKRSNPDSVIAQEYLPTLGGRLCLLKIESELKFHGTSGGDESKLSRRIAVLSPSRQFD